MIAPAGDPDVKPVPPLATGKVPVIVLPERLIVLLVSVVVLVAVTMLVGVIIVDSVVIIDS